MGDTITLESNPAAAALEGFKQIKPRVFAGVFPVSSDDYEQFREALIGSSLRCDRAVRRLNPVIPSG